MNKSSATILISFIILSLVLLGVLVYGVNKIRKTNEEISTLVNEADLASEQAVVIQRVRNIKSDLKDELTRLEDIKLTEPKLVSLIETIESSGKELDLETDIVSVSTDNAQGNEPQIIKIIVTVEGGWASNLSFLHAIENLPYRVMIDNSTLSKNEDGTWSSNISLAMHAFK